MTYLHALALSVLSHPLLTIALAFACAPLTDYFNKGSRK